MRRDQYSREASQGGGWVFGTVTTSNRPVSRSCTQSRIAVCSFWRPETCFSSLVRGIHLIRGSQRGFAAAGRGRMLRDGLRSAKEEAAVVEFGPLWPKCSLICEWSEFRPDGGTLILVSPHPYWQWIRSLSLCCVLLRGLRKPISPPQSYKRILTPWR
jgi:hypothetical protein